MTDNNKTVLLVEDQPMLAMMTQMWLSDLGLTVVVSNDGLMAKRLLESQSFDYMVTDLVMPNLDGAGLLEWMQEAGLAIPTIVISGINDAQELAKIRAYPFVREVLEKPLTPEQLLDAQVLLNA
ncbi:MULTISPECIES: response regulator [Pseudomonadota]|uniref:response regulator n=1 Tax=Pseudomonadota TaxID=1224 RepID=UPI001E2AD2D2|nr:MULTISPECIES: response regulator [Pseudomonadota]MCC2606842.1 response regulator [Planctobacterium marinum]